MGFGGGGGAQAVDSSGGIMDFGGGVGCGAGITGCGSALDANSVTSLYQILEKALADIETDRDCSVSQQICADAGGGGGVHGSCDWGAGFSMQGTTRVRGPTQACNNGGAAGSGDPGTSARTCSASCSSNPDFNSVRARAKRVGVTCRLTTVALLWRLTRVNRAAALGTCAVQPPPASLLRTVLLPGTWLCRACEWCSHPSLQARRGSVQCLTLCWFPAARVRGDLVACLHTLARDTAVLQGRRDRQGRVVGPEDPVPLVVHTAAFAHPYERILALRCAVHVLTRKSHSLRGTHHLSGVYAQTVSVVQSWPRRSWELALRHCHHSRASSTDAYT